MVFFYLHHTLSSEIRVHRAGSQLKKSQTCLAFPLITITSLIVFNDPSLGQHGMQRERELKEKFQLFPETIKVMGGCAYIMS